MVVSVPGAMAISSDGERYIQASETPQQTGTADVKPLGLRNAALGGSGLNNMGILVRTWGKVVENDPVTEPAWFTIDDGSGLNVKCVVPSGVTIDQGWNYVGVISASSCEEVRDDLYPLIRVREQDDIRAH